LRVDLLNGVPVSRPRSGSERLQERGSVREFWRIARSLRCGTLVADRVFDEVFPLAAQGRSSVYWTPVEVAVRAAILLADKAGATILDIGSGVGKFCIVAAAAVNANARGIEHRPHLVDIAREAAAKIGVAPAFQIGTIEEQDVSAVDGFYLFNPFAENLCSMPMDRLDASVELSEDRYWRDVAATERLFSRARVGARVVTYCGFGGKLPEGFVLVLRERCGGGRLELWVKEEEAPCRALPVPIES